MKPTIAVFLHHPICSADSVNGVIAAMDRRVTACWTDAERATLVSLLQRLWLHKT